MSDKIVETSTDKTNYGPNYIGNVIRILDEYTLIVNAGFSRLYKGDKIVVYTIVEPIIDWMVLYYPCMNILKMF